LHDLGGTQVGVVGLQDEDAVVVALPAALGAPPARGAAHGRPKEGHRFTDQA
jgi:hypothetical protein